MEFGDMGFSGKPFVIASSVGEPWVYTADDDATCEISDSAVLRIRTGGDVTYLSPSAWISVEGPPPDMEDTLPRIH